MNSNARTWKELFDEMVDQGMLYPNELDQMLLNSLEQLGPEKSMEAMSNFADAVSRGSVDNKGGFMKGILNRITGEKGKGKWGAAEKGKGGWGGGKGGKGKGKGDQYYGEDPGPHGSSGGYGNWGAEERGPPGGGEPGNWGAAAPGHRDGYRADYERAPVHDALPPNRADYERGPMADYDRGGAVADYDRGGAVADYDRGGAVADYDRGGAVAAYDRGLVHDMPAPGHMEPPGHSIVPTTEVHQNGHHGQNGHQLEVEAQPPHMPNAGPVTPSAKEVQAGLFQKTLAEQVKQMLKPYYQKQDINKEQFKLIVKKSVEKLVAAHGNEVENTQAAVGTFMTEGRVAKIQKLVDGYVKCYSAAKGTAK